jgi:hypothetical protein
LDNLSLVYINVYDWEEVGRLREDNPSPYGCVIEEEIENQQL